MQAIRYPFERPGYSYLYVDGEITPLFRFDAQEWGGCSVSLGARPEGSVQDHLEVRGLSSVTPLAGRYPVIAAGSNAAPSQLRRKYADQPPGTVFPVVRAALKDFVSVYSAHFTPYGAVAAALQHWPGAILETYVLFLDEAQLHQMHRTESLGQHFEFVRLEDISASIDGMANLNSAYIYRTLAGCLWLAGSYIRLATISCEGGPTTSATQEEMLTRVGVMLQEQPDAERLVRLLASDPAFRKATAQRLRPFSRPFSYPFQHTAPFSPSC